MAQSETPKLPKEAVAEAIAAQSSWDKRKRLDWAVRFAQEDLETLSPGRLVDLRLEMTAFCAAPGWSEDKYVELFSDAELRWARAEFRRMISTVLAGGTVRYMSRDARLEAGVRDGRPYLDVVARPDTRRVARAAFTFVLLLGEEGHRLKACHAPKLRGKANEECGRWFVGRPDQSYCSPPCQNRASTRDARRKAARHKQQRRTS